MLVLFWGVENILLSFAIYVYAGVTVLHWYGNVPWTEITFEKL